MPRAESKRRVALLIDCDNQSHEHLDFILKEAAKEGDVLIQHAFGNWASPNLAGWRKACEARGVRTIQTPSYVPRKNTSDMALAIEAMDILHREEADAFCIVTSDSDFAPLALRLKEGEKPVIGIVAKEREKQPFANHCTRVATLPASAPASAQAGGTAAKAKIAAMPKPPAGKTQPRPTRQSSAKAKPEAKAQSSWVPAVAEIVRHLSADGECPQLSRLGQATKRNKPQIDYKKLGFKTLTKMIESEPGTFQIKKSRVCLTEIARKPK